PLPFGTAARTQLYDHSAGLADFEAVHYVGEGDVYNVFLTYAHAAPTAAVKDTFMHIRGDEEGHQELAYQELVRLVHGEKEARRLIRGARLGRAAATFGRLVKGTIGFLFCCLLAVLYFPIALLLWPFLRGGNTEVNVATAHA